MTIFDLLFIAVFLTSVVTLVTAAVSAIRGRGARAIGILRVFAICFATYMGVVFAVALAMPKKVLNVGDDRCFDDWCIAVKTSDHRQTSEGSVYSVVLRISSRARRISQRAKGAYVYLADNQGRRFDHASNPEVIPIDVLLGPGQAVETERSFIVPKDSRDVGLVVVHEGSYCFPGCFIIGDGSILRKRAVVALP